MAGTGRRAPKSESRSTRQPSEWDLSHPRVTFYCPENVLDAVEKEMQASGRSKSQVIVDALREHLRVGGQDGNGA